MCGGGGGEVRVGQGGLYFVFGGFSLLQFIFSVLAEG